MISAVALFLEEGWKPSPLETVESKSKGQTLAAKSVMLQDWIYLKYLEDCFIIGNFRCKGSFHMSLVILGPQFWDLSCTSDCFTHMELKWFHHSGFIYRFFTSFLCGHAADISVFQFSHCKIVLSTYFTWVCWGSFVECLRSLGFMEVQNSFLY